MTKQTQVNNKPSLCTHHPVSQIEYVVCVYYESSKGDLKTKPIYEFRWDERLKTKVEESTRLGSTLFVTELEHLKIETRLTDEMLASEMGEYVFLV